MSVSGSKRAHLRFWVGLVAMFGATLVLCLAITAVAVPWAMGWHSVSIVSGSMEPLIGVGDVIVAEPYSNQELVPSMVVVFEAPVRGGLVSHRIESMSESGTITTRGDANSSADSDPISADLVVSIGRVVVPAIGWPAVWARSGSIDHLVFAALGWLGLLYCARWGALARFDPWNQVEISTQVASRARARGRGRHLLRPRRGRVQTVLSVGTLMGLVVGSLTVGVSSAGFASTTANIGNDFVAGTVAPPSNLQLSATCALGPPIVFRAATTTSGQGDSFTVDRPAGTVLGDTMLTHIVINDVEDVDDVPSLSIPPGWTLVRRDVTSAPVVSDIYVKIAGPTEPSGYSWTISKNTRFAAAMGAWANVDLVAPIEAHAGQTGSGSSLVAPSVTTTIAETLVLAFWSISDNQGVTVPISMIERWESNSNQGGNPSKNVQGTAASERFIGFGPTGPRTATSPASESHIGQTVALRPSIAGSPAVIASWTATPSTFAAGYKLQRWQGALQQNEQTVTPRTTTTATDSGVVLLQTYTYKLFSFFENWESTEISATVTIPIC